MQGLLTSISSEKYQSPHKWYIARDVGLRHARFLRPDTVLFIEHFGLKKYTPLIFLQLILYQNIWYKQINKTSSIPCSLLTITDSVLFLLFSPFSLHFFLILSMFIVKIFFHAFSKSNKSKTLICISKPSLFSFRTYVPSMPPFIPPSSLSFSPPFLHCHSLRYSATCTRGVFRAWVGSTWWSLFGQAAAFGEAIWTVQSSELAASHSGPGVYCLWHQVLWTCQPGCVLGRLPERGTAGGAERGFHHRLVEEGSGTGGGQAACQRGSGRLWRGQETVARQPSAQWYKLGGMPWVITESPETFSYDWWRKLSFAFWLHCPLSVGDPAWTESLLKDSRWNWAATWTFIISERNCWSYTG